MNKLLLVFLLGLNLTFGQSAGNSGLSFLKLGFGARNVALGEAGTSMANDVTSLFYNSSRLTENYKTEIFLMHNEWIQGIQSEILGIKFNFLGLPFGCGFNSTSINDIEIRQKPGESEGTINAHYVFGTLATGYEIDRSVSVGVSIKYIYEGIWVDEANGWGFDFSSTYKFNDDVRIVAAVRNIGAMNKLKNESTKLPTEFRIGSSYDLFFPSQKISAVIGAEFQKYINYDDYHILIGSEVVYDNTFAIRLGYQTMYEAKNISMGFGLYWGGLNFDYAMKPFSYDLGAGHTFSLKMSF
jgi:hypothetical protein